MMVRVIERADGGVSIIRPVRRRRAGETARAYHDDIFGKATRNDKRLHGRAYVDLDDSELPPDREHRDSWRLVDGKVVDGNKSE